MGLYTHVLIALLSFLTLYVGNVSNLPQVIAQYLLPRHISRSARCSTVQTYFCSVQWGLHVFKKEGTLICNFQIERIWHGFYTLENDFLFERSAV